MDSIKSTARTAGVLYLVMATLMILGYVYFPARFIVPGDAAATARRIIEGELLYRIGILNAMVGQILFVFVVLLLYQLFKDVDRKLARLMVALVCVGVSAELVNIACRMAPLTFLSGADYLSVFTRPQLEAIAMGFIRLGAALGQLLISLWGLWLFPFGLLTIKSGYFPKWLGFLLFASGVAYVATFVTTTVFPAQRSLVLQIVSPFYVGEIGIVLWLVIRGARVTPSAMPAAAPSAC